MNTDSPSAGAKGNSWYKACILAAGKGSRMENLTKDLHKGLLPLDNKPILSHIIEAFPKDVEIVMPVGYKKELIRQYVSVAHPDRKITLVEVDNFEGPGSGPGYSILKCKEHLQCPFVLDSIDTIVMEDIPPPDQDWFGIAEIAANVTERYCTARLEGDLVVHLDNKVKNDNRYAYIGLAGIRDYRLFWESLTNNKYLVKNEYQVTNGFAGIVNRRKLHAIRFSWHDTGTEQNYLDTAGKFSKGFTSLEKTDECIFFVDGLVIKYFKDPIMVSNRVERTKILEGFCPKITAVTENFYAYRFVEGVPMSKVLNDTLFSEFLQWSDSNFWQKKTLSEGQKKEFKAACIDFYRTKTLKRIESFYKITTIRDREESINGYRVPKLSDILAKVDWESLTNGVPVNFHGDYFIENIIYRPGAKQDESKFVLIDWRQNFGGIVEYGDIYYDLAKLNHGIKISHEMIRKRMYDVQIDGEDVSIQYGNYNNLVDCQLLLRNFVEMKGYDYRKVEVLTALIYLNIAALHSHPYNLLLYYLGKLYLYRTLKSD
ncbi:MAG: NTP transferase domain-containing protein [Candidatus Micrarchaeia archaeon]